MIMKEGTLAVKVNEKMRGGEGKATLHQLLHPELFCGHGRLFTRITLEPGSSIGWHVHTGESETFCILQGEALFNDNGTEVPLRAGDCTHTRSGEGHSIKCAGPDALELIALIVNA